MQPDTVRFTGLEIAASSLRSPRKVFNRPYPAHWERYQWVIGYEANADINRLDRYLEATISGRWGSYSAFTPDGTTFVVLFEEVEDAVMFRLKNGEDAFLQPEDQWS